MEEVVKQTGSAVESKNDILSQTTNRIVEIFKENGISVHEVKDIAKNGSCVRKTIIETDSFPVHVKHYEDLYDSNEQQIVVFAHNACEVARTFGERPLDLTDQAAQKIIPVLK